MATQKRKTKSKTKAKRRPKAVPAPTRLKALLAVMVLLTIAGIAAVKFFQTPSGRIVLLDRGFHTYYAQVRDDIGEVLRPALQTQDLRRRITESAEFARVDGERIHYLVWRVPCDRSTDFIAVNVAITNAVERMGARVRLSEEHDEGRRLVLHVGTRRFDTHRITLLKGKAVAKGKRKPLPKLALVIDDFGYSRGGVVAEMIAMDLPLSIAIIPMLPQSGHVLETARAAGKCTLLHLPMEADGSYPFDAAPVMTTMSDGEIVDMVASYLETMPGIDGVNNHQGSRATADRRVMELVLEVVGKKNLFFLDSLTSPKSVAYNIAKDLGLPTARNSIFLDADTEDSGVVEERLRRVVSIAKSQGTAVAIGHPHRWTLEALRDNQAYLRNAGVELVYVSELVH